VVTCIVEDLAGAAIFPIIIEDAMSSTSIMDLRVGEGPLELQCSPRRPSPQLHGDKQRGWPARAVVVQGGGLGRGAATTQGEERSWHGGGGEQVGRWWWWWWEKERAGGRRQRARRQGAAGE
jgi:hypothetical protein